MSSTFRRLFTPVLVLVGTLFASLLLVAPSADAKAAAPARNVVSIAASKAGAPYRYGATGPSAFDCSGFTRWVYAKAGRHLPRTSSAQAGAARHVSASDRRPGDLVFFHDGGGVYHVAIYAGSDSVWHAPRPGETVHREHLWTNAVSYGRVG
jgi:cell wall-associated NlpC family hydrolase